jgi:hypothetical protein
MPLQAADLIEPAGELTPEMFPGKNLAAFVAAWLAEAVQRSSSETAQRAFVYYRAYTTVVHRMNLEAMRERKGDELAERAEEQMAFWRDLARQHYREFTALTGATPGAYLQPVGIE